MLGKLISPQDIREAAAAKGISMRALMRESGVQYSSFSRWERGLTSVNYSTVEALLRVLEDDE